MSLKEKTKCWICNANPPKETCLSSCIETKDYNDAVSLFWSAVENPEKHPELIKKFEIKYNISFDLFTDWKENGHLTWLNSTEWRDFLFRELIGGKE